MEELMSIKTLVGIKTWVFAVGSNIQEINKTEPDSYQVNS